MLLAIQSQARSQGVMVVAGKKSQWWSKRGAACRFPLQLGSGILPPTQREAAASLSGCWMLSRLG